MIMMMTMFVIVINSIINNNNNNNNNYNKTDDSREHSVNIQTFLSVSSEQNTFRLKAIIGSSETKHIDKSLTREICYLHAAMGKVDPVFTITQHVCCMQINNTIFSGQHHNFQSQLHSDIIPHTNCHGICY